MNLHITMNNKNIDHYFLRGGGEMGELIRAKDWTETPMGNPENWTESLRTMVAVMLENPFGMCIVWGKEYIQLYNDSYRSILGTAKHPQALGVSIHETFSEVWHIIEPMLEDAINGKAVGHTDLMLPLNRNGLAEKCYFDFSCSPIRKSDGEVGGVLITVAETTDKRKDKETLITSLQISQQQQRLYDSVINNTPDLTYVFDLTYRFTYANDALLKMWGKTKEDAIGRGLRENGYEEWHAAMHEREIDEVVATKKSIRGTVSFPHAELGKRVYDYIFAPIFNEQEEVEAIAGTTRDITDIKQSEDAIKESEQRFKNLVRDATAAIVVLTGPEMKVEIVNEAYGRLINLKPHELLGKPLFSLTPETKEYYLPVLEKVRTTGEMLQLYDSQYVVTVNGKHIEGFLHCVYQPYRNIDGNIIGVMVIMQDVTEAVLARKKIEQSEQRFQAAIKAVQGVLWTNNGQGEMEGEQLGWASLTGQTYEEYQGYGWSNAIHPDDSQPTVDAWNEAVYERKPFIFEHRVKTKNGEWRNFSIRAIPLIDTDGNLHQWVGVHTDITEQKESEQKIKKSEQKFRLLADSMPQHIWTANIDGNLNYFNQSVFDYSGLTIEEINENGWIRIVHPEDREENIKKWMDSITTGQDFLIEHRFRRHDGVYRWQLSRAIPQKDSNGNIQMWVGTSTDIEDQKTFATELERQVDERTKELGRKNNELENMNKELESFVYISSHDLQEPLRKIQTFASYISEKEVSNLSEMGKDYFDRMFKSAQRMQILIQDLLAYSRTNSTELNFENTDLNEVIDEIKDELKEELKETNATIETNNLCEAYIIPFQFRQLMNNLIINSLKFSVPEKPPHIRIKCEIASGLVFNNVELQPQKQYCHITVSDNGIGFEPQYSEKIFELFKRLHGRNEYKGTGIGLAIVKKIIDNHNGIIVANGKLNEGATFDIYIPTKQ
jgi:PAS domain S-box-containing protein